MWSINILFHVDLTLWPVLYGDGYFTLDLVEDLVPGDDSSSLSTFSKLAKGEIAFIAGEKRFE